MASQTGFGQCAAVRKPLVYLAPPITP